LRRVLITGGTGFVGPYLIRYLQTTTASIAVMASGGSASRRETGVEYYEVDIRRSDAVSSAVREIGPIEIYHLAGVSAVDLAWANPRLTFEVNVVGTYNLLEAAMELVSPPRILNISTAQVYARSDGSLTEESPVSPDNPYAASKAMAEMLGVSFRKAKAGGIITARSFNHAGPGQLPTFVLSSIAKQFAEMEIGLRPAKLIVGNIDVRRDFTDVRDVVRAYAALLDKGKTGQVYNVCSGIGARLSDIIKQFQAICKTDVTIEIDPARLREGEIPQVVGDSTKIRKETAWTPQIPMDRTIRDLMDYWREKFNALRAVAL
jgi:GDP-4-dehydro-6-deoxy-D-mannose reductase